MLRDLAGIGFAPPVATNVSPNGCLVALNVSPGAFVIPSPSQSYSEPLHVGVAARNNASGLTLFATENFDFLRASIWGDHCLTNGKGMQLKVEVFLSL
jgi:hypothetical protein